MGQFCGKLLGDLGADVVKIEPPGGERTRHVRPVPRRLATHITSGAHLSFWHCNTSKRGITINLETAGRHAPFGASGGGCRRHSGDLSAGLPRVSGTRFREAPGTKPGADHVCTYRLRPDRPVAGLPLQRLSPHGCWRQWHRAATIQADVPNAPPIAPGGGNAWHMGCHYAFMASWSPWSTERFQARAVTWTYPYTKRVR